MQIISLCLIGFLSCPLFFSHLSPHRESKASGVAIVVLSVPVLCTCSIGLLSQAAPVEATSESDPWQVCNANLSLWGGASQLCIPVSGCNARLLLLRNRRVGVAAYSKSEVGEAGVCTCVSLPVHLAQHLGHLIPLPPIRSATVFNNSLTGVHISEPGPDSRTMLQLLL